jgi:hypothetical protein
MPNQADLGAEVAALGTLIGLLTRDGDEISVNTDWFKNPLAGLETIPNRLGSLVKLIDAVLGPGVAPPLTGFSDALWYPIPLPGTGKGSILYLVAPKGAPSSGQIGCGALYSLPDDEVTYGAFAYIPLFSYDTSGAELIAGNAQNPLRLGLSATSASKFRVDGVCFTALNVEGHIFFANQVPTVDVEFINLTGTRNTGPFNTLDALLATDVDSWIGEVIVQGDSWLSTRIGDTFGVTVGAVLVGAGFLTVDDNGLPGRRT